MAQDGPRMDQNRPDMTPKRPGIDFEKQLKNIYKYDTLGQSGPNKAPTWSWVDF